MIAVDIPQGSLTDLHHLIHPNNSLIFVHIVADPRFLITSQWLKTRKDRSAEFSKVYEVRNTKPCSVQLYVFPSRVPDGTKSEGTQVNTKTMDLF